MAQVSITIPDAVVPRVRAALRAIYPGESALTDVQLFQKVVSDHVRALVVGYERAQIDATYEAQADTDVAQVVTDMSGIG